MNNSTHNISRRETLTQVGLASAGAAALLLNAKTGRAQNAPVMDTPAMPANAIDAAAMTNAPAMDASAGDLDVVRLALQLEQLGAAFYAQAVEMHQKKAFLSARAFELTRQIAGAKAAHVAALQGVLTGAGTSAPAAPNFQFPADAFISAITFARLSYTFEEIGIGAYLGAVGSIQSDAIRQAAASIYGVKAQHAAILRNLAGFDFSPKYYEVPLSVEQVTGLIAPYIVA